MRSKKLCYGVLLVLSIMLGLSLNVSSNVNALKYPIDSIPFAVPSALSNNGFEYYKGFYFEGSRGGSFSSLNDIGDYFNGTFNNGRCEFLSRSHILSDSFSYYIPYYIQPPSSFSGTIPDFTPCYSDGELSHSAVSGYLSTLPLDLLHYLPYRFDINGAFISSSEVEDGNYRGTRLNFTDLFPSGNFPDSVYHLRIPIGLSSVTFNSGDIIQFTGSFYFDSDYPDSDVFTLNSNATGKVYGSFSSGYSSYADSLGLSYDSDGICSLIYSHNSNPNEYPFILSYSCNLIVPPNLSSYSLSGFYLDFTSSSNDPIWTLPHVSDMVYDSSFVVTNYDDTLASSRFQDFNVYSNDLDSVPGYVGSLPVSSYCVSGDWLCELSHLFGFTFSNPFASLFNLFVDPNSCAQIPTLAGMLHSTESEVCPWFSSSTRNILTPVIGLSSMMLLFGFAVRWLGARSGNFIEDSGGVDSGGYHLENKFRRKK